jgi:NhaA family Na+:H+ antiporter
VRPFDTTEMSTVRRSVALCQEFSLPLLAGVVVALLWANLGHESYEAVIHWSPLGHHSHLNLHFLVNDLFMVLFFGLAAKEITESVLPGGALNPPSKAVNPLLGTLGGVLGPVGVYFAWVALQGTPEVANGWGIPTATDIALAWLVARLAFGPSHPAVSFLLLLAVADDGLGLGIIAIFYPDPAHPVAPAWLGLVAVGMAGAYALRRANIQRFWLYLAGPGVLAWSGLFLAHLHPALALVAIVPFMPHGGHDEGLFADEGDPHGDALNRFEHAFRLPVDFGLFFFGLANAGVGMSTTGAATSAVLIALLVGKTVGIFGFSMVGHALGFKLPEGMDARSLFVVGVTASLGLTVALFVAGVAFTDPTLQGAAKMGALASALAAPLALVAARLLRVKERFEAASSAVSGEPVAATQGAGDGRRSRAPSQPPPSLAAG